jgi:hypothetical protein
VKPGARDATPARIAAQHSGDADADADAIGET